jgi:hypothetical protein
MSTMVWKSSPRSCIAFISSGDEVEEKLFSFLALADGWHFGQGRAPEFGAVVSALRLISGLRTLGANSIEVFPGSTGSILVSAFSRELCVDVTVSDKSTLDYVVERDNVEVTAGDSIDIDDLFGKIRDERWLECASSDSCTQNTSAKQRGGLHLWRLKIQTGQAFRWSTHSALKTAA